jgi:hypothetical protein
MPSAVLGTGGSGALDDVVTVAAGEQFSLALLEDGTVRSWGNNLHGKLGDGTMTTRNTPVPVKGVGAVGMLGDVISVRAGEDHSLALLESGEVRAWGSNGRGQLGDGTTTRRLTPVPVAFEDGLSLTGATSVAAGWSHSAALLTDGSVLAWGANFYGELGDGTTQQRRRPTAVVDFAGTGKLRHIVGLAAGISHTLALDGSPPDDAAPIGTLRINGDALTTASFAVMPSVAADDGDGLGVADVRFSGNGVDWSDWMRRSEPESNWMIPGSPGTHVIYAQFRDFAGNVSEPVSDAIDYDPTVSSDDFGLTINEGSQFTNDADVILSLPAKPYTAEMQVSNDGGFAGAIWQPYSTKKAWRIRTFGDQVITDVVYVKYRSVDGEVSDVRTDDIVYDPNPPEPAEGAELPSIEAGNRTARLDTRATDDRSGVLAMMLSNDPSFDGAQWEPYRKSRAWPFNDEADTTVYVRYRDGAGNVSRAFATRLADPAAASVPAQLMPAHALGVTSRRPSFRWAGVSGARAYQVQVSKSPAFTSMVLSKLIRGTSFRSTLRLPAGEALYWRVRVAGGEWSPAWAFDTPAADAPRLISPAEGGTTPALTPKLRWRRPAGANAFQVQVGRDDAWVSGYETYRTATPTLTLPPLAREATYWWRVRAKAGAKWGAWSASQSFSTPQLATVALRAPRPGSTAATPIVFDWLDVSGATSYRLQVCRDEACTKKVVRRPTATASRLTLAGALAKGTYWWRVQAVGPKGAESAWSRAWRFVR